MTHDDETVERVARAIYEAIIVGEEMHHDAFDDIPEPYRRQLLFEARAALSAMPERELLREALEALDVISGTSSKRCPFTRGAPNNLQPEDPCPVCGDKGDFSDETTSALSRCVGNAPSAIARAAADKIRAALTQEKQT